MSADREVPGLRVRRTAEHTDDENAAFWQIFDGLTSSGPSSRLEELLAGAENEDDERFLPELDEWDRERDERPFQQIRRSDPAVRLANEYGMAVYDWLKQCAGVAEPASDKPDDNPAGPEHVSREEALEVVSWYSLQIGIKLARALSGAHRLEEETRYEIEEDEDEWGAAVADEGDDLREAIMEGATMERDGSAKVSLTGIERSLGAWTILRDRYPRQVDTIRGFQTMLARLRRHIDHHLPGARTCQRPGFEYEV